MPNNIGAFGENFPYANQHNMNMDWVIKIAKDFLDKYSQLEETLEQGKEDLETLATQLEAQLNEWYDTHSEDIANQLADSLNQLNTWFNEHSDYLDNYVQESIDTFVNQANAKALEVLETIPSDYSDVALAVKNIIPEYVSFMTEGKNLFVLASRMNNNIQNLINLPILQREENL